MTIQKVKQNISNMKKVRLKEEYTSMTEEKIYYVTYESEQVYILNDDDGDERFIPKCFFEEVEEPNYVMVRHSNSDKWKKSILLHDLGEQFECRYITVCLEDEDDYLNGSVIKGFAFWYYMKPINEVEEKIEELEQKLAELKQQLNK